MTQLKAAVRIRYENTLAWCRLLNKEMHFSLSCVLGFPVELFLKVKVNY